MLSSLLCAASCLPSVQDADGSWDGFRNDSGLKVALIKCTGDSLTIATQPRPGPQTSSWPPCPVRDGSTPPLSYCNTLNKETADTVVHYTHVCNWELTASTKGGWPPRYTLDGRWVVNGGFGDPSVYPRSLLLCSTLAGGCVCLCSCACVWSSVAVFMASQDVEVTVSCRVVCRPALQHHHPNQTKYTRCILDSKGKLQWYHLWPHTEGSTSLL